MYCKHCGSTIADNSVFCCRCGERIVRNDGSKETHTNAFNYHPNRTGGTPSRKTYRATEKRQNERTTSTKGRYEKAEECQNAKMKTNYGRIIRRCIYIAILLLGACYSLNPDNNILNINSMRKAYSYAQEVIQDELLSPSSAVFPKFEPEFVTQRTKTIVHEGIEFRVHTVTAYVDSDNAFGAHVRCNFVVEIGFPTDGDSDMVYYNIISLE